MKMNTEGTAAFVTCMAQIALGVKHVPDDATAQAVFLKALQAHGVLKLKQQYMMASASGLNANQVLANSVRQVAVHQQQVTLVAAPLCSSMQ